AIHPQSSGIPLPDLHLPASPRAPHRDLGSAAASIDSPKAAGAPHPPSSLDPHSSRLVAPSDPVAMLSLPPPAPPAAAAVAVAAAAAADEKRPSPPMKAKLLFPYAVSCVFGGMRRAWGMALVGLHALTRVVKVVSFTTDAEEVRFLVPIFRGWVYLGIAAVVLVTCVDIVYYLTLRWPAS
ncbi:hypothetical protein BDA96_05G099500, partial [Sorghum bicolor]